MATNWLFVIVFHILSLISQCMIIPDCQLRRISFTAGPADIDIPCGVHKLNVTFHCKYNGSTIRPQWIINSERYSSVNSELPPDHLYDNWSLTVSNIHNKNDTFYQCQVLLNEGGEVCVYRSTVGRLIIQCKAMIFNLQCSPVYYLTTHYLGRINTTFSQISTSDTMYTVAYSDSTSGSTCHSKKIPASSCVNGVCKDIFNISSSLCPNTTNVSMTVSFANDSHKNLISSDPIKVDAENKFVGVSINMSESWIRINCTFFDQPLESNKTCGVRYGPSCQDLSLVPAKVTVDYSKSVIVNVQNFSNITCFGITASNDTKTVNLEGFYYSRPDSAGSSIDVHQMANVVVTIAIWFTVY